MTISNNVPVSSSVLRPGDTFSFDIDDTYTSLVIYVNNDTAYSTALSGAQPGFTVVVSDDGAGTHTFTVSQDSGFAVDPTTVKVVENESGSETTTTVTYYLTGTARYAEGMRPYDDAYKGDLLVTDNGVQVRVDVGWLDFVGFSVTDLGNGKVRIEDSGGGGGGGYPGIGQWALAASTADSDPGAGNYRLNDVQASATFIYISDTDKSGVTNSSPLQALRSGDFIKIQATGSQTKGALFVLTGTPTNATGYTKLPISLVSSGTALLDVADHSFFPLPVVASAVKTDVDNQFAGVTNKANPVDADLLLIEDSAAAGAKKRLLLSNLLATLSTQSGFGIWQYAGDADTTPASAKFSFDTSGISIATNMYVHENSSTGMDLGQIIGQLKAGDQIYVGHASLRTVGSIHTVNGTPTLTTNVWDIPLDGTAGAVSSPQWALDDYAYFVVLPRATQRGDYALGRRSLGNTTIGVTSSNEFDTNNAVASLVTTIRVNILNDMLGFWDNPTQAGTLKLLSVDNPNNYIIYDVTAIADVPSYGKDFTVAYRTASGSFGFSGQYAFIWTVDAAAGGTDTNAIHDNVAAEISPLALVTAAAGDHILIEDASDANNKKRVAASDFLGGSATWDPGVLSPMFWFRGDIGVVEDGTPEVTNWYNSMGQENNSLDGNLVLNQMPIMTTLGGKDALSFDGVNDNLVGASSLVPSPDQFTIWCVYNNNTAVSSGYVLHFGAALGLRQNGATGTMQARVGSSNYNDPAGSTLATDQYFILVGDFEGTDSVDIYWNSATPVNNTNTAAISTLTPAVGSNASSANYADCDIAEWGVVQRVLTPDQITNLIDYLTTRYGL